MSDDNDDAAAVRRARMVAESWEEARKADEDAEECVRAAGYAAGTRDAARFTSPTYGGSGRVRLPTISPVVTPAMLDEQYRRLSASIDELGATALRLKAAAAGLRITRADALDELADALADACDLDVTWHRYAEAALRRLEKHGLRFTELPDAEPDR